MKKFSKIASIFLALILAVATPVLLTGCESEATLEEVSRAMVVVADNYKDSHKNYDNFADLTLKINATSNSSSVKELEYKTDKDAEQTTKGTFTNTSDGKSDVTIAVKNVSRGEGDALVKDVHLSVTSTDVTTEKGYELDGDDVLQEVNKTTTTTKTYVLGTKDVEGNVVYYVTEYTSSQVGSADAVVSKNYYSFANRSAYISAVNGYLTKISKLVKNSYFFGDGEESLMILLLGKMTKDGDRVSMSVEYTVPSISESESMPNMLVTMGKDIVLNGNEFGKASQKMSMETLSQGKFEMNADLTVENAAGDIEVDVTGYTAKITEITIPSAVLPTSLGFGFDFD